MNIEQINFTSRAARAEYVARRFPALLQGKVLDVGCDNAVLRTLIPAAEYTGIDIGGKPDFQVNLEQTERLAFPDGSFACVVCTDVLEHLENLHDIFGELVRVSNRHLIISLPNNWTNARRPIEKGSGSFGKYGLPAEKPMDRHKWFFNLTEAAEFLKAMTQKYPVRIVELFASEKPKSAILRGLRRMRYPSQEKYLNRYAHTLWAVLEKTESKAAGGALPGRGPL